jgi:predicted acyltransferase
MPTVATALLGAVAGELIRRRGGHAASVRLLLVYGAAALGVGVVWSGVLPLSKPLWTGSFVLVAAGLATLALAAAHFVVDVRGQRRWSRPFLWLGVNPLAIYVGSEVVGRLMEHVSFVLADTRATPKAWLFWEFFAPAFGHRPAEWASLAYAAAFTAVWIGFAGLLYRWRIRVRA